jgi:hypothetical protein
MQLVTCHKSLENNLYRVATFMGKPGNLEKSGKSKMISERSGINQTVKKRSGKIAIATRHLTLAYVTCLMCIDSTAMSDY